MMKCDEVYLHICDSLDEDLGFTPAPRIKTMLNDARSARPTSVR